jgi:hypothetical protein
MEITCTLNGQDLARQRGRWQALGFHRELTDDGLRLTFDRPDEAELRELVALENDCCAWARWTVEGDAVVVRSTGHGIEALHGMFA